MNESYRQQAAITEISIKGNIHLIYNQCLFGNSEVRLNTNHTTNKEPKLISKKLIKGRKSFVKDGLFELYPVKTEQIRGQIVKSILAVQKDYTLARELGFLELITDYLVTVNYLLEIINETVTFLVNNDSIDDPENLPQLNQDIEVLKSQLEQEFQILLGLL